MAKRKFAAGLILLLILLTSISLSTPATANPGEVKWSRVDIPTEGKPGKWVLADSSDIQHLTMAIDGSLYCYAEVNGEDVLFKSDDDGRSWAETDYDGGAIADIVGSSIDASIIYVTDGSHVYRSEDAGDSFQMIADATLPTLDANESITCLDAGYVNGDRYLFIGTADADDGDPGSVYYIAEASLGIQWTDLEVGNYDVYSIAHPPEFANDSQIIAVATDEARTWVINNQGVIGTWYMVAELVDSSGNSFDIAGASDICFPSSYDDEFFVGVAGDAVDGGIYRVHPDAAYRLDDVDADIISLNLIGKAGNTQLMAGAQDDNEVYYSTDDGDSWDTPDKTPTGDGPTYVVMAEDFAQSDRTYAATSGTDSAFSYTADGGETWNQVSLIDTGIQTILDLVPSPNHSQDDTLFMLTFGGEHSLWRSLNDGTEWERVFSSTLPEVNSLSMVELSPQYGNDDEVVFLAGTSNGNAAIWKSTDNGQSFRRRSAPSLVDIWAVVDDDTLFIGSFDGNNGLLYSTSNSGQSYSDGAVVGDQSLNSMALSPDYNEDETILIGNTDGWVFWSGDNGTSFEPLPWDTVLPPFTDSVTVAFDPDFSSNSTVYAASDTADEGIYRFIIDTSTAWESIDSTLPEGGMLEQLALSENGTLYATNFKADGGMERCLNPTYSLSPTFETVTRGLDDGAKLTELQVYGEQLWSIDTANVKVMTFTDSLTLPVTLTSPPDKAPGIGIITEGTATGVSLDWEALSGATSYERQLDDDTDFSDVPFEEDTEASSAQLPALEPATTYYWRVRATEPVLSPWSDKWSFTTSLGTESMAPSLLCPEAGTSNIPLKPVFQWSAIAGADSYELIVSTDASLVNPTILKIDDYALPTTAWQCNIDLSYDTTYYWKVRATSGDTYSGWSAVGAFTTCSPPEETLAPSPSPSPASTPAPTPAPPPPTPTQPDTPDWVKYLVGALLLTIILLLITMLALVTGMRRP